MSRATLLYLPTSSPTRGSGREHVVFESIVALLALLLIISGFSLYVGQAFTQDKLHTAPVPVADQTHAPAYSLAEM